jgi:Flp pilus assembly pilin Flp
MTKSLRLMLSDDSGGTLVEYALIVALIAVVAILAVSRLGANNSSTLSKAAASI